MKDKFYYPFYDGSLYVLIFLVFFIGRGLVSPLFVSISAGISFLGFCLNYFIKINKTKKMFKIINPLVNVSGLLIFFWIGFSLSKTGFVFEKIVFIFVKSIYAILVVLSFNYKNSRNPFYVRCLTLLLFLSYPIFMPVETMSSKLLSLLYLLFLIMSLRFDPDESYKQNPGRICIVFLVYLVFVSCFFVITYHLKKDIKIVKVPGNFFLMRTDKFDMEDKFYLLQDYLMEEGLAGKSTYNDEQSQVISFFSTLFKATPYTKEAEKSYLGLTDIFRRRGPGIEESEGNEFLFRLKEYKDIKISNKMNDFRNNLFNKISRSRIGFKNKISSFVHMNKAGYSDNLKNLNSEIEKVKNNIEKSLGNKQEKKEIKNLAEKFKNWKTYSFYNDTRNKLGTDIENSVNEGKKDVLDFYKTLERETSLLKLSSMYSKFKHILNKKLKKILLGKEKDNLQDSFKKMIELKIEMSLSGSLEEMSEEFKAHTEDEDIINEALDFLKAAVFSQHSNDFYQNINRLKELLELEDELNEVLISNSFNDLIESKAKLMFKKETEIINDSLNEGILNENKKIEFVKSINKTFYSEAADIGEWGKIKRETEKFFQDGLIYEEAEKKLINSLIRISEIGRARRLNTRVSKYKEKVDYAGVWKETVRNIDEDSKAKEKLKSLMDGLVNASTMQEVKATRKELFEKLAGLKSKAGDKTIFKKMEELIRKTVKIKEKVLSTKEIAKLILGLNEFQNLSKNHNDEIDSVLKELREVYFEEKEVSRELIGKIKNIDYKLSNINKILITKESNMSYKLFVLPRKMVISKLSLSNVRVICEYRQNILKDVTSEVKWQFQGTGEIVINEKGLISVVSLGRVKAIADYNGIKAEAIDIYIVKSLR